MLVSAGVNIGVYHLTIDRRQTEVRDLGEHESPLGLPDSMAEPGVFNPQKVRTEAVPQTNSSGLLRDAVTSIPHIEGVRTISTRQKRRIGAAEWIRTTTLLLAPAPQAGASASSATAARGLGNYKRAAWKMKGDDISCGEVGRRAPRL